MTAPIAKRLPQGAPKMRWIGRPERDNPLWWLEFAELCEGFAAQMKSQGRRWPAEWYERLGSDARSLASRLRDGRPAA